MHKKYSVKEMFWSLQGEGRHALWPAIFVRFAGCNLWDGQEKHRARDAERHHATCPKFCDTDFVGGERLTAIEIAGMVKKLGAGEDTIIVLTGGEPFLQADSKLLLALRATGAPIHVETNGTIHPGNRTLVEIDWICLSPKTPPDSLELKICHELKVILPQNDPLRYVGIIEADYLSVQPEDGSDLGENIATCAAFVKEHPKWKVTARFKRRRIADR